MHLYLESIDSTPSAVHSKIGGIIYLTIGEHYFPEENWYDYVSLIMEQWIPALISFAQCNTDFCKLTFWDGPCFAILKRNQDATTTVSCFYDKRTVIEDTLFNLQDFLKSVMQSTNRYCRLLHLQGKDHSEVSSALQKLKEAIRTVR